MKRCEQQGCRRKATTIVVHRDDKPRRAINGEPMVHVNHECRPCAEFWFSAAPNVGWFGLYDAGSVLVVTYYRGDRA